MSRLPEESRSPNIRKRKRCTAWGSEEYLIRNRNHCRFPSNSRCISSLIRSRSFRPKEPASPSSDMILLRPWRSAALLRIECCGWMKHFGLGCAESSLSETMQKKKEETTNVQQSPCSVIANELLLFSCSGMCRYHVGYHLGTGKSFPEIPSKWCTC